MKPVQYGILKWVNLLEWNLLRLLVHMRINSSKSPKLSPLNEGLFELHMCINSSGSTILIQHNEGPLGHINNIGILSRKKTIC